MRAAEFFKAVEAYGVTIPTTAGTVSPMGVSRGLNSAYRDTLGLGKSGIGSPRYYTPADVRRTVAYCRWMDLVGKYDEWAIGVLASRDHGWVVRTAAGVSWVPTPSPSVFRDGAICVPVPEWQ